MNKLGVIFGINEPGVRIVITQEAKATMELGVAEIDGDSFGVSCNYKQLRLI